MGPIYTISPASSGHGWTVIGSRDQSLRVFTTRSEAIQFAHLKMSHERGGSIRIVQTAEAELR